MDDEFADAPVAPRKEKRKRREDETETKMKTVKKVKKVKREKKEKKPRIKETKDSASSDSDSDSSVEIISHKEKRKRKKVPQEDEDEPTKKVNRKSIHLGSQRGDHGIWIGNLPFSARKDTIREFFKDAGEITRVHMPKNKDNQNKGFAYVDFTTSEAVDKALALSESEISNRKVLIKSSSNFEGRPTELIEGINTKEAEPDSARAKAILAKQKHPPCQTLFIGNLGFEATKDKLQQLFGDSVKKVRIGTFEDSGKCKGWAFVDFKETASATGAILDPKKHWLDGRKIRLEFGSEDAVRRGGGGGGPRRAREARDTRPVDDASEPKRNPYIHSDRQSYINLAEAAATKEEARPRTRPYNPTRKAPRQTSGLALATAQRQKASISHEPVGQKIVFD